MISDLTVALSFYTLEGVCYNDKSTNTIGCIDAFCFVWSH